MSFALCSRQGCAPRGNSHVAEGAELAALIA
jgi:hypothetical protein